MRCPACQHESLPGARFCLECGSRLGAACSSCNAALPANAKFCGQCGEPVAPVAGTRRREPHSGPDTHEGERRQLTVMFCDLVASTPLSERLDPEELRDVIRSYQAVAAEAVGRYEGTIAQYLGDGVLVYFGYPRAHEDDAERAVRGGLATLAGMDGLNARLERDLEVRLALRIGIHTGPVVVGEVGDAEKHERAAIGETVNVTSRLSDAAPTDSVLISNTTQRLVQGLFACESLGDLRLKGLSHPVAGHRVLRESGVAGRLAAAAVSGLSPFVGREQELALLVDRWRRAKEGAGQVVLVSGEAGIGKSRLIGVLRERLAGEPHVWLECRCSPYHRTSALYPVITLLEQVIGIGPTDPPDEKLSKLEDTLARYAAHVADAVPLLASLLSIPFEERHALPAMTPQRQKHVTIEALLDTLLAITDDRAVVFLVEDLHWVDPSTLELLSFFVDQEATSRALVLLAYRPEFLPPWPERTHMTHLMLSRLTSGEAEALVAGIGAGHELPSEALQQVVAHSDGIPLFAEELTKMVLEGDLAGGDTPGLGGGPLPELAIPSTLQDSLMARLDRLSTEKQVAQVAACIGRAFSYELLCEVAPFGEETVAAGLGRLTDAELVYARGLPPRASYQFKHALIQEAAYLSLLKKTRRLYHRRIAEAIEKLLPDTAQVQPELLAQHFTEAGCKREAIAYWLKAGQRAIAHSATEEAIDHLSRGIELVAQLEDPAERIPQELVFQTLLGVPLTLSRGYGAPEVEHAFGRAYELAEGLGEGPELFEILHGLRGFYAVSAKLERARELGDRLARMAERMQDPETTLRVEYARGAEALFSGRLPEARAHLERAIDLCDPQRERAELFTFTEEPGAGAYLYASWTYWLLGHPDRALRARNEALAIAQEVGHPNTLAFAYAFAAALHKLRGEPEAGAECAEAAIRIGEEQGFPFWVAMGTMFRGWALTRQGKGEDGIAEIRRGFEDWQATGAQLGRPFVHAMLAEVCGQRGHVAEAAALIDEAQVSLVKGGERYYEPELHRLRGDLRHMQGAPDGEVDACLEQAITVARDLQARSLELRAVTSRARLLRDRGESEKARRTLAQILAKFTEGFDTRDLKDAQALLADLSDGPEAAT